jgi:hypothetical protein
MLIGGVEGMASSSAARVLTNLAFGCDPFTGVGMSMVGGFFGGGVGGGVGWWWRYPRKEVQLIAFQGVSPRNWKALVEDNPQVATGDIILDDLAMYGHTGWSLNQGRTIWGFRPSDEAMQLLCTRTRSMTSATRRIWSYADSNSR